MKVISKALWVLVVIFICGGGLMAFSLHASNQHAELLMAQYNELRAKPYVTLQENKKNLQSN